MKRAPVTDSAGRTAPGKKPYTAQAVFLVRVMFIRKIDFYRTGKGGWGRMSFHAWRSIRDAWMSALPVPVGEQIKKPAGMLSKM